MTNSRRLEKEMKIVVSVSKIIAKWLAGSAITFGLLWCFLVFCEDGAKPSPWVSNIEMWWCRITGVIAILFGFIVFRIIEYYWLRYEAQIAFMNALAAGFNRMGEYRRKTGR